MLINRPSASTLALLAVTAVPFSLHAIDSARAASTPATSESTTQATTTQEAPTETTATQSTTQSTTDSSTQSSTESTTQTSAQTTAAATSTTQTTSTTSGVSSAQWGKVAGSPRSGGDSVTGVGLTAHAAGDPGDTISDYTFSPATITVHVGDTITWTNNGPSPHTATASNGSFNTGTLKKGQSASHTFTQAGTFAYICTIHPFMHGTVVVLAQATSNNSSGTSTSGTSATTTATTTTATAASTGGLPSTGLDLGATVLCGLALAGLGWAARRWARTSS